MQHAAGQAYRAYQGLVHAAQEVVAATNFDVRADAPNYEKWKQFDTDYLSSLNDLCGHPNLGVLTGLVQNHLWPSGGRRDYSDWEPTHAP